ncbi:MAG: hypothetical protein H0U27_09530 [Nitrosopumilus sp.]|nr:hypothetical protein [Nitrosopumilus sp.]
MTDKVAIVCLTEPEDHARVLHAFEYAFNLQNHGIKSEIFLDGAAVRIGDYLEKNPKDPASVLIKQLYQKSIEQKYIREACNFCAHAFSVKDEIIADNIPLSKDQVHIDIGKLVKEKYQIITI